jgi:GT2 family glycosyltransferase
MDNKVSLIWLNYNSMHIRPLIEESLRALANLGGTDHEIVLVDNGSTDGSYEFIRDLMPRMPGTGSVDVKIVRNSKNEGFVGGMNAGFRARDPESRYCMLVNNDAVVTPDSVDLLVGEMEKDRSIGAAQGVVSNLDNTLVDSAGSMIDELLIPRFLFDGEPIRNFEPRKVAFVEGTYPIYRISALESFLKGNIFIPEGKYYFLEDILNGLMLWNEGYSCMVFPYRVARHYRRATIKRYSSSQHMDYHLWKNRSALLKLTDSRYKGKVESALEKLVIAIYMGSGKKERAMEIARAMADGSVLGEQLVSRYGFHIVLRRCPLVRLSDVRVDFRFVRKLVRSRFDLWRIPYV